MSGRSWNFSKGTKLTASIDRPWSTAAGPLEVNQRYLLARLFGLATCGRTEVTIVKGDYEPEARSVRLELRRTAVSANSPGLLTAPGAFRAPLATKVREWPQPNPNTPPSEPARTFSGRRYKASAPLYPMIASLAPQSFAPHVSLASPSLYLKRSSIEGRAKATPKNSSALRSHKDAGAVVVAFYVSATYVRPFRAFHAWAGITKGIARKDAATPSIHTLRLQDNSL